MCYFILASILYVVHLAQIYKLTRLNKLSSLTKIRLGPWRKRITNICQLVSEP